MSEKDLNYWKEKCKEAEDKFTLAQSEIDRLKKENEHFRTEHVRKEITSVVSKIESGKRLSEKEVSSDKVLHNMDTLIEIFEACKRLDSFSMILSGLLSANFIDAEPEDNIMLLIGASELHYSFNNDFDILDKTKVFYE